MAMGHVAIFIKRGASTQDKVVLVANVIVGDKAFLIEFAVSVISHIHIFDFAMEFHCVQVVGDIR